ncbi:MAG: VCBS repeat-containing protein [Elusimicrobia bacterium]|nr:VCBS repeat-containing protein [Elusimicrobiota bacterium]
MGLAAAFSSARAATPTGVKYTFISSVSLTAVWTLDTPVSQRPHVMLSTTSDFSVNLASTVGNVGDQTTTYAIVDNSTFYFKVKVYAESDLSYSVPISAISSACAPTGIVFDEISAASITASAYAPTPGFMNLDKGQSGVNVALGAAYAGYRNGNAWASRAAMTTARYGLASAAAGGRIYALGGWTGGAPLSANEEYDPVGNAWTTKQAMPTARYALAAAAVGGKVYALGGSGGTGRENEEYDPVSNTWAARTPMPTARQGLAVAAAGDKLYAVGGVGGTQKENEEYDPATNGWTSKTAMPTARSYLAAAGIGNRLYAIGGLSGSALAANEEFNPILNAWTSKAPLSWARSGLAAAVMGGKLYALGGSNGVALSSATEYDPGSNAWSTRAQMLTARQQLSAAAVGGKIHAVGGSGGANDENEKYDPGFSQRFGGLTPNTLYSFKAKARNADGIESAESAAVSTYTWAFVGPTAEASTFTVVTASSFTMSWSSGPISDSYNPAGTLYRAEISTMASCAPVWASSLTLNAFASFAGLDTINTHYYARVFGINSVNVRSDPFYLGAPPLVTPAPSVDASTFTNAAISSLTVNWSSGTAGSGYSPAGTAYVVEVSTLANYSSVYASSQTRNLFATVSNLAANTTQYIRVAVFKNSQAVGSYGVMDSTVTMIETPAGIAFDEISASTIIASAYAPTPALTNLQAGQSGVSVAVGAAYAGYRNGNTWTSRTAMTTARSGLAAAAVGGKVYAIGGVGGANNVNEEYDPASFSWAAKAAMPTARYSLAAAAAGGRIYAIGGAGGTRKENEEYDPVSNTWASKTAMPTAREALAAAVVEGKIYAMGGYTGGLPFDANEEYDPLSDTWTARYAMPTTGRYGLAAAAVGNKIYAVGGQYGGSIYADYNQEYNPASDSWLFKAAMPTPRYFLAAAAAGGKLYAVGGSNGVALSSAAEYDPGNNTWTIRQQMLTARQQLALAAAGGKLYAVGGSGGTGMENEEYDPGAGQKFAGLAPNAFYSFKAKARGSTGLESPESPVVSTCTWAFVGSPAPASTFTNVTASAFVVNWSSGPAGGSYNPAGTWYQAEISTMAGFVPVRASSLTLNAFAYFSGLETIGTQYYARAYGINSVNVRSDPFYLGSPFAAAPGPSVDASTFTSMAASSFTVNWSSGSAGSGYNPAGTAYQLDVSTMAGFAPLAVSSQTLNLYASATGLAVNTTQYVRVAVIKSGKAVSAYGVVTSTATWIETPTSVVFDDISTHSITASAYAQTPAFSGLPAGPSGFNVSIGGVYAGWRAGNIWTDKATLTTARYALAAAAVGGRIYAVGGWVGVVPLGANEEYDPVGNAWAAKAAMTTARYSLAAAALSGKVYAVGGMGGTQKENEEYDPAANTWASKALMTTARNSLAAAAVGGKVYAVGGTGGTEKENEEYDPNVNTWASKTAMTTARSGLAAAAVGGKIYAVGGSGPSGANEEYDPATNGWTSKTALTIARSGLAAAAVGGKIYAVGGTNGVVLSSAAEYDPGSNTWSARAQMPTARQQLALAATGGKLYALGGIGGANNENKEYDPGFSQKFTGLTPNTLYTFKARGRNASGAETPETPAISTYTLALAPGGLVAASSFTNVASTGVRVNWSSGTPAGYNPIGTLYRLELATAASFTTLAGSSQTYNTYAGLTGLTPSTKPYFARVEAISGAGIPTSWLSLGSLSSGTLQVTISTFAGTAGNSYAIAWGDYDNDGNPDLAVANYGLNILLLRNNGNGTFAQSTILATAGNYTGIAWGDTDNDGLLDLAVAVNVGDEFILHNDGGGAFTPNTLTGSGGNSYAVAWGDYDNDGRLDLAVANDLAQDDYVARNNGNGTFAIVPLTQTLGNSRGIAWGDYNNDGYLDLAIGNTDKDVVIVRNNNGVSFSTFAVTGSGFANGGIAWGDYDKDGYLDLAFALNTGIVVLRNNGGDGTFAKNTISAPGSNAGVAWTDYNGDGRLDLAVSRSGGQAQILLRNDGGVSFTTVTFAGSAGGAVRGFSLGNFDLSGGPDIALANDGGSDELLLHNDDQLAHAAPGAPSAGFSATLQEYSLFSSSGILALSWGNGTDAETSTAALRYLLRIGTTVAGSSTTCKIPAKFGLDAGASGGSFLYSTRISSAAAGLRLILQKETTVYWAVMTQDGEGLRSAESAEQTAFLAAPGLVTDLRVSAIVSTGLGASSMTVTLQWTAPGDNGYSGAITNGAFEIRCSTTEAILSTSAYAAAQVAVSLATSVVPGALQTHSIPYLNAAATHYFALTMKDGFGARSALSNPATAQSYVLRLPASAGNLYGLAWGDYDGDGRPDMALSYYGGSVVLMHNDGSGAFTQTTVPGTSGSNTGVAWGDFNSDGRLDLAVAVDGSDEYVLRNNGDGTFTNVPVTGSGGRSYAVAWGDYDNDGLLDLAVANETAQDDLIARNNGNGTFTLVPLTQTIGNSRGAAWGDFNNDGFLDLAIANTDKDVVLARNLGNGTFSTGTIGGTGVSTAAAWGDYNNDNYLDLAVANSDGVALMRNKGDGTFAKVWIAGTAGNNAGLAWADFNNNGFLDLLVSRPGGSAQLLLRNNGDGTFTQTLLPLPGSNVVNVSWGDFDADGDLDIAAGSRGWIDAFIFRNDAALAHNAPAAPVSGFSATFQEYAAFSSTGVLTLSWGDASDVETPTSALNYLVRAGTVVSGSSATLKIPFNYGLDGAAGGGSFPYGTRVSALQRGLKFAGFSKGATIYWAVAAEDGEALRSGESAEQTANLTPPASVNNLAAAQDAAVETSSVSWVRLTWTVPGENGTSNPLLPGARYDLRWSTVAPVALESDYNRAPNQSLIPADGESPGATHTQLLAVTAGKTYYFAMTTLDSCNSRSGLSNAANIPMTAWLQEVITDAAPPAALQGDTTAFLKLRLWTNLGSLSWTKLRVRKLGTLPDAAVKNVAIYGDANTNGIFDSGDTAALYSGVPAVFASSAVTLAVQTVGQTISNSTRTYFLTLQLEPSYLPQDGSTAALKLDGEAFSVIGGGVLGTDFPGLLLDGIDDRVRASDSAVLDPPNQITLDAWVRTTDPGPNRSIITHSNASGTDGYRLWLNGSTCGAGVPTLFIGPSVLCANRGGSPVSIADDRWHQVSAVYSIAGGLGQLMFIDGEMLSTGPVTGSISDSASELGVGGPNNYAGNYLNGKIDEARISQTARYTSSFIPWRRSDTDYNTVLQYHFDAMDGTGTVVTDAAGQVTGILDGQARGYGRSTATVVVDAQDMMMSSATSLLPDTLYRNAVNVPVLKLQLWASQDNVIINRLSVAQTGTGASAGVANLRLYRDNGDGYFQPTLDQSLTLGQVFSVNKATFDLLGATPPAPQQVWSSTKTYFVVWDVTGGAETGKSLGLAISTDDFVLAGATDAVSTAAFPLRASTVPVVSARVYVTPETPPSAWVNVSSLVFIGDFTLGNVDHFYYLFDQNPGTQINGGGSETLWTIGKATATATADGSSWYFHVRAFDYLGQGGTQTDFGPYFVDRTRPTGASFVHFNSTGGALGQSQVNDLAQPVTAQLSVQDSGAGLNVVGPAPLAPSPGTVSLWRLDDTSGAVWKDSGPASISLSSVGVVSRGAGRFGSGVLLAGSGDLRSASPAGLPTGAVPRAIEAWINPVSTQGTLGLVSWGTSGAGTLMRFSMVSGQLAADMGGITVSGGPVLSTGVWQHAAFSYDGSAARLYLNGALAASQSVGALATALGTLFIGATESGGRFWGSIDEVRIMNSALADGQVYDDCTRGHPYFVAFSSSAGSSWQVVVATGAGAGARVGLDGAHGSTGPQTLKVKGLPLNVSTSSAAGALATNQVIFYQTDRAGNTNILGPYGILVDTNPQVAYSTPILPGDGMYTGARPWFEWTGPSTAITAGMGGANGLGGSFYLQVSSNDPTFADPNIVLSISTPAIMGDNTLPKVYGVYLSTHSLGEGATYYWRIRSKSFLDVLGPWGPWKSFVVDASTPAAANYRMYSATGGVVLEGQYTDLMLGVTAQTTVTDNLSGFSKSFRFDPAAGTVALWHFSERDGLAPKDASGNNNTAALLGISGGPPGYRTSPFGAGLRCGGSHVFRTSNAQFDFPANSNMTFEAWVNPDDVSGIQALGGVGSVTFPGGNWLLRISDGRLFFSNNTGFINSPAMMSAGVWQHIAMTLRGARVAFYINGVQVAAGLSGSGGNSGGPSVQPFTLCAAVDNDGVTYQSPYSGMIDEVRVLNYAADPLQIAADYAATLSGIYAVEYSTTAGASWIVVSATAPASGWAHLELGGSEGSVGPEAWSVRNLQLVHSTSAAIGYQATNQIRFSVPDRAGNTRLSGPYAAIVDTTVAAAVSTPSYPANGAFLTQQPNFLWSGPSTKTASGMGLAASYFLEAAADPAFASPVISISTPVIIQSTFAAATFGAYLSTYTLMDATTYYWRVRSRDFLGLLSPPLSVSSFVTDLGAPAGSAFRSFNSTGGATAEDLVNNLTSNVTAYVTFQDPGSGLKVSPAAGAMPFGVIYSTTGGAGNSAWVDGGRTAEGGLPESWWDPTVATITALATFQSRLYAGAAGPGRTFEYDGTQWSQSGTFPSDVLTLKEFRGKLYAGLSGGSVYSFDGISWNLAASLPAARVNALAEHNGRLYAATGAEGQIFAFDPDAGGWYEVFRATEPEFFSLKSYNGRLFAGAGPDIYSFDGSTWTVTNWIGGSARAFEVYRGRLYAGTNISGYIYAYDGSVWTRPLDISEDFNRALGVFGGRLYLGASLPSNGRIYMYDGNTGPGGLLVYTLPTPADSIYAIASYGNRLYLGGTSPSGAKVYVSTPLAVSLTGLDGAKTPEQLKITGLNPIQSVNANICNGNWACTATNQVRFTAADQAGNIGQAGPFAILVDPSLSPPTALYPPSGSFVRSSSPTFVWAESSAMSIHNVQVSSQAAFTNLSLDSIANTPAYTSPVALANATTYYWQVRSRSPSGIYSAFSAVNAFVMDLSRPTTSVFLHFGSTGGPLAESQFGNLAAGVTVEITLQDIVSGLDRGPRRQPVSGAAALYPFDEGFGMYASGLGGEYRLAFSSGASWAPGLISSAVLTGGATYLYNASPNYNPAWPAVGLPIAGGTRTIEAWIYPLDGQGGGILHYSDFRLHISGSCSGPVPGNSYLCVNASQGAAYTFTPSQWHHVAYTYAGGTHTLYADGILLGSFQQMLNTPGAGPIFVGTATDCGAFRGRIDELRILAKALSAAEVDSGYRLSGAFRVSYSSDGGANWTVVTATAPAWGPHLVLSGPPGSTAPQTLRLENFSLAQSTILATGAYGTNQVVFSVSDQAGNEATAGPFTVLVQTSVPQPILTSLTPRSTESIFATAIATDPLSGVMEYRFEASPNKTFAPPVSTSPWVAVSTYLPTALLGWASASSYTFTGLASATTYYVRVTVHDNLSNLSPPSDVGKVAGFAVDAATSTYGSVFFSTKSVAPASALQNTDVAMLKFMLATPLGSSSQFYSLTVRKTGTAPDAAMQKALIAIDNNGDGIYTKGVDAVLAEAPFTNSVATLSLAAAGNSENLGPALKTFFIAYRVTTDAQPGLTVGVDNITEADFGLQFPSRAEGPFPTNVPLIPIADGPNALTVTAFNLAPAEVQPNTLNVALLRLSAATDTGTSIISTMTWRLQASQPFNQLTGLTLWRDKNGNGLFEPGIDERVTSGNDSFTNGYSTMALTTPEISSRTVKTSAVNYFLSANVSASAPQGTTFRIALSTPPDVRLENPLDTVSFTQIPIITSSCTIIQNNIVWISTTDLSPGAYGQTYFQGNLYSVLRATLSVDIGFAEINQVTMDRTGDAQQDDVQYVAVYRDQNLDGGPLNPVVDVFLGSAMFDPLKKATIDITTATVAAGATTVFFIAYQINPAASPGRTLGGSMTNSSYFHTSNPASVVSSVTMDGSSLFEIKTATAQIEATQNQMKIPLAQSAAPGAIDQVANDIGMLRVDMVSDRNNFNWLSLIVRSIGTALDSDVRNVRVFRDDGNGLFSASSDTAISDISQTFTGGQVNIPLSIPQAVTGSTQTYFVTLSLNPSAVPGRTVGVVIPSTASFNVSSPNKVSSQTALGPFAGGPVAINQFANTIAVSTRGITPPLGAVPGARNVGLLDLTLKTNVSNAGWAGLKIDQAGSASDSDITEVKVYYDLNNSGFFDPANTQQYLLVSSTGQRFGQVQAGSVDIVFPSTPSLGPAPQRYFVAVDLADDATPGKTVALRAISKDYFVPVAPNQFGPVSFNSQPPMDQVEIKAPPALMYVLGTSSAPAEVAQGTANVVMAALKVWMSSYTGQWTQLSVDRSGAGIDSDISGVKLFYDTNGNGRLDVMTDERISTASFIGGTAALMFSTQTITTSSRTYYLTYDLSMTAVGDHAVGAAINAPGLLAVAMPNSVSSDNFPFASAASRVVTTRADLFVVGQNKAPGMLIQGATNQVMLSLQLSTTEHAILWSGLTVRSLGTAADSDISSVHIWKDVNADGFLEADMDQDMTSGLNGFLGGSAVVSLITAQTISMAPMRYLVTVDVASCASPSASFGLTLAATNAFSVNAPNTVVDSGFPISSVVVSLKKRAEQLLVSPSDLVPATGINQGLEASVAKLALRASRNKVGWTQVRLARIGTLSDSDIEEVRLYRDEDASGALSPADILIGAGTYNSGSASIVFAPAFVQTITLSTQTYLVSYKIKPSATVNAVVGLTVAEFTVDNPDSVSLTGLPFSTSLAKILDSRTPSRPVVTVADGAFSSKSEYLQFNWQSSVVLGYLAGAFYAIGTTTGGTDLTNGFKPIRVSELSVRATGFVLQDQTMYYVSVKTQSNEGWFSPVGTSNGVFMDFVIPPTPAAKIHPPGESTLRVSWGSVTGGLSGIAGYRIEYRRAQSPVWYNAKTKQPISETGVSAAGMGGKGLRAAAVSPDELVTGVSYQATDMPSGTLYVRMRAFSTAGLASAPTDPEKVQMGPPGTAAISQISCAPNPFDSRTKHGCIVYTLSQDADVTISIFNVFGGLIKTMSYSAGSAGGQKGTTDITACPVFWDGTDESGQKVSKGIYLAVIQSGGAKEILKIGVIH